MENAVYNDIINEKPKIIKRGTAKNEGQSPGKHRKLRERKSARHLRGPADAGGTGIVAAARDRANPGQRRQDSTGPPQPIHFPVLRRGAPGLFVPPAGNAIGRIRFFTSSIDIIKKIRFGRSAPEAVTLFYAFRSIHAHAASAAAAPSAAAVEICRTAFVRQSPATKIPAVRVVQRSSAAA